MTYDNIRAENRRHLRARGGTAAEDEGVPSAESDCEGENGRGQGYQQAERSGEGLDLSPTGRCTRRLHAHLRQEDGRGQRFRYGCFEVAQSCFRIESRAFLVALKGSKLDAGERFFDGTVAISLSLEKSSFALSKGTIDLISDRKKRNTWFRRQARFKPSTISSRAETESYNRYLS